MGRSWIGVIALAALVAGCGGDEKAGGQKNAAATAQNRYPQGAPLGTKAVYNPQNGLGTAQNSSGVNSTKDATGSDHGAPASAQTGGSGSTR